MKKIREFVGSENMSRACYIINVNSFSIVFISLGMFWKFTRKKSAIVVKSVKSLSSNCPAKKGMN